MKEHNQSSEPQAPLAVTYRGTGLNGIQTAVFKAKAGRGPTALNAGTEILNHSGGPMTWGDTGKGSIQLALAILADATNPDLAVALHRDYAAEQVASWKNGEFETDTREIGRWLETKGLTPEKVEASNDLHEIRRLTEGVRKTLPENTHDEALTDAWCNLSEAINRLTQAQRALNGKGPTAHRERDRDGR